MASFQEAVAENPELVDKVMAASSLEEVVAIAGGEGFVISVEELASTKELSDAEAESIAGGHGFHDTSTMSIAEFQQMVLQNRQSQLKGAIYEQIKVLKEL